MNKNNEVLTSKFSFRRSMRRYQATLIWIYFVGMAGMVGFNFSCYPGTIIGTFGWAIIWPVSIIGYVFEFALRNPGTLADTCFLY